MFVWRIPSRFGLLCLITVFVTVGCQPSTESGQYAATDRQTSHNVADSSRSANECPKVVDVQAMKGIGDSYFEGRFYESALRVYNCALELSRPGQSDPVQTARIKHNIGRSFYQLGKYIQAEKYYKEILEQSARLPRGLLISTYGNLGSSYSEHARYEKSLTAYQNGLRIAEQGDPPNLKFLAMLHIDIGLTYTELGNYPAAFRELDQADKYLAMIDIEKTRGRSLHQRAYAYYKRGEQYKNNEDVRKSITVYDQALVYRRKAKDEAGEGKSLNSIGYSYAMLGQYQKALTQMQQALKLARQTRDRGNEGRTLDSIAVVYREQGKYDEALELFYEALVIAREMNDHASEYMVLANIGKTLERQGYTELAIVFLKQSVTVIEAIRKDIKTLPAEVRKDHTRSVESTYRLLADLLLRQKRLIEAERVINLLRIEELDRYFDGVRAAGDAQLPILENEQGVWLQSADLLKKSLEITDRLEKLKAIPDTDKTEQDRSDIKAIRKEKISAKRKFATFWKSKQVRDALSEKQRKDDETIQLTQLGKISSHLAENEIIFYPLILPDRLELIYIPAKDLPLHFSVPVKGEEVNKTILAFRQALFDRSDSVKTHGRKLYQWFLEPLDRAQAGRPAEARKNSIIYIPDGTARYIPLAALYDGKDWVARHYSINVITALSLTDFSSSQVKIEKVLGGAFTVDRDEFDASGKRQTFSKLPYASVEVKDLEKLYPGSRIYDDKEFKLDNFITSFPDYQLVHLATHGVFTPGGSPEESFILFGDGENANLLDIQEWLLGGVDMVVLSACQTAVGGKLGNGDEIQGFGYSVQKAGAKAVIATLWDVSDGGTQAFMSLFYRNLKQPGMSKTEALRLAQLAMIDNKLSAEVRNTIRGVVSKRKKVKPSAVSLSYEEPFFWAPFLLIGNGN